VVGFALLPSPALRERRHRGLARRPSPLRRCLNGSSFSEPWLRRTNVWRIVTSPVRGAKRLRSGTANGQRHDASGSLLEWLITPEYSHLSPSVGMPRNSDPS